MRLICPNCGAQYEVEDSVIPDDGRDVQCSNCGHTWFQRPAHLDKALAEELDQEFVGDEIDDSDDPAPQDHNVPGEGEGDDIADAASDTPEKPARERRGLDPDVTDVLRQEAAHEAAARRGETSSLETQPELGLSDPGDAATSRTAAARARMARLRTADDTSPESAAAALASASRRDLLPDIEEINSSLRASQDREDGSDTPATTEPATKPKSGRGGFRGGFFLIVLLAVIAVAIYVMAPQIIRTVPQTEPYLIDYVAFANDLRVQAADGVAALVAKIKALIAGVTGG